MDEAERRGLRIDDRALARDLGVPVVAMSARNRMGLTELAATVDDVVHGLVALRPRRIESIDASIDHVVRSLAREIEREYPGVENSRWIALRLLEGDPGVEAEVRSGTLGKAMHGGLSLVGGQ
jgi:ferrous iron transport protein B